MVALWKHVHSLHPYVFDLERVAGGAVSVPVAAPAAQAASGALVQRMMTLAGTRTTTLLMTLCERNISLFEFEC